MVRIEIRLENIMTFTHPSDNSLLNSYYIPGTLCSKNWGYNNEKDSVILMDLKFWWCEIDNKQPPPNM